MIFWRTGSSRSSSRFADGRLASFDFGFTHPMRQWLEIVGTSGTISVDEMWVPAPGRATFQVRREGRLAGDIEVHALEGQEQIQHMLENFGSYVLEGKPVSPSPEEAVKTLKVLDALAKSARHGKEVDVV